MARNGSGTYSLSDTIAPGDPQSSTVLMGILNDIASALTSSVAADGQTTLTGPVKAADGSASAPSYTFGSDANTGLYRKGADNVAGAANGAIVWEWNTSGITLASGKGLTVPGTLTVGGVSNAHVPTGAILLWSGSVASIPTGWLLCDGTNGTPDLRDKFVIGARQDDSGTAKTNVTGSLTQTGGSKDAIAVSHTHTATSSVTDPGHNHAARVPSGAYNITPAGGVLGSTGANSAGNTDLRGANIITTDTTGITVATTVTSAGSSGTNANLPPYYALAYIMKA